MRHLDYCRRLRPFAVAVFCPLLSALLLALAFPPYNAWWLAWVALVPFAVAVAATSARLDAYYGALVGGVAFHLIGMDWLRTSYGGSGFAGSNAPAWLLQSLVNGAFWPLGLAFSRFVNRRLGSMTIALPSGWIFLETARATVMESLLHAPSPWLHVGLSQSAALPIAQVADLGGVRAVSALVAAVNGAWFDLGYELLRRRRITGSALLAPAAAGALVVLSLLYGGYQRSRALTEVEVAIRLMSPDLDPLSQLRGRLALGDPSGREHWLWSEKAFSCLVGLPSDPPADDGTAEVLTMLAKSCQANQCTYLVGCPTRGGDRPASKSRNSIVVVDPDEGFVGDYDKTHLVPWSEYVPYRCPGLPAEVNGHAPGTAKPVLRMNLDEGELHYALAICYDTCFARFFRQYMSSSPAPDMFLISSCERSDATRCLAASMLAQAQFRAIEIRRPLVRAVEGGFSGLIDSTGAVRSCAEFSASNACITVRSMPIDRRKSLYSLWGETPLLLMTCAVAVAAMFRRVKG